MVGSDDSFPFGFTAVIFRGFHSLLQLLVSGWAGSLPSIIPAPFVERALCPHENHRGGDFRQGACRWVLSGRVTGRGKAFPGE